MYAAHFGLAELPFNNSPDPRYFHTTPEHEEALACLIYAVQERKGYAVLTGEVGAGKTMVARMMLRHFGSRLCSAVITNTCLSADELVAAVCAELEIDVDRDANLFERTRALEDYLVRQYAANVPVVLVLDEAQRLSDDALEQIRMIGNLEADNAKLLQIVLVGQPELRARLHAPHLRQLQQRIFRSFHLSALSRPQTRDYIRHRLRIAAGSPDDDGPVPSDSLFDEEAFEAVHAFSAGLPRLINTACDNVLLSAYAADKIGVTGPVAREVLDQLSVKPEAPTPVDPTPRAEAEQVAPQMPEPAPQVPAAEGEDGGPRPRCEDPAIPDFHVVASREVETSARETDAARDSESVRFAEASAKARDSVLRLSRVYDDADRIYTHLIHHLSDSQRTVGRAGMRLGGRTPALPAATSASRNQLGLGSVDTPAIDRLRRLAAAAGIQSREAQPDVAGYATTLTQ